MKVILTEKVQSLGNVGEIVNVSSGYARNFLFPKKVAMVANERNEKYLENQKKKLAKKIEAEKIVATEIAKKVNGLTLEFTKRISGNGKLFGTISTHDISTALNSQGIDVEKRLIVIETPIKTIGTFDIQAKLFKDVDAAFKVKVILDPVQAEEIKKKEELALKKKKEAPAEEAAAEEGAEASADSSEEISE